MKLTHNRGLVAAAVSLLILNGCSTTPEESVFEESSNSESVVQATVLPAGDSAERSDSSAIQESGILTVHRRSKEYDIRLTMNVGMDNIYFYMALPDRGISIVNGIATPIVAEAGQGEAEAKSRDSSTRTDQFTRASKHILKAQTLVLSDDLRGALFEANQAVKLTPDLPMAHALRGSIFYKLNRIEDARQSWIRALELDPEMEDVRDSLISLNR
jgi:tetratricopeptide (TPR) repeat protein